MPIWNISGQNLAAFNQQHDAVPCCRHQHRPTNYKSKPEIIQGEESCLWYSCNEFIHSSVIYQTPSLRLSSYFDSNRNLSTKRMTPSKITIISEINKSTVLGDLMSHAWPSGHLIILFPESRPILVLVNIRTVVPHFHQVAPVSLQWKTHRTYKEREDKLTKFKKSINTQVFINPEIQHSSIKAWQSCWWEGAWQDNSKRKMLTVLQDISTGTNDSRTAERDASEKRCNAPWKWGGGRENLQLVTHGRFLGEGTFELGLERWVRFRIHAWER